MAPILLDIDGVLHVSGEAVEGAAAAIERLRREGHALRFVTNNTTRPRGRLAAELQEIGFALDEGEIETTPLAAARTLSGKRVLPLTMPAIHGDLAQHVELVDARAEVVLVGGVDDTRETLEVFAWDRIDAAFAEVRGGARLVCLHRNKWWTTRTGARLDSGAVVAGLEYAAGVTAEVVGKPSRPFYESALQALDARAEDAVMIGDDVESDVGGAKALGMRGVLVRTGKFEEKSLAAADPQPDAVLDSVADLPDWVDG
jgi:HAD superfamily hydrolase (TIGR01458 family)